MVAIYQKKPVKVEAIQFTGDNMTECRDFIGMENIDNTLKYPNIVTPEGVMAVSVDDWIIRGTQGEVYPCKPKMFADCYELVTPAMTWDNTKGIHIDIRTVPEIMEFNWSND